MAPITKIAQIQNINQFQDLQTALQYNYNKKQQLTRLQSQLNLQIKNLNMLVNNLNTTINQINTILNQNR